MEHLIRRTTFRHTHHTCFAVSVARKRIKYCAAMPHILCYVFLATLLATSSYLRIARETISVYIFSAQSIWRYCFTVKTPSQYFSRDIRIFTSVTIHTVLSLRMKQHETFILLIIVHFSYINLLGSFFSFH